MMIFDKAVLLVLDGVGVGALPDAAYYQDADAATLQNLAAATGGLSLPHLEQLGLGCIASIQGVAAIDTPRGCWGKMAELSSGKDSVTGHWELLGCVLEEPFATYPAGFPPAIIEAFTAATGLEPLGNYPASGTDILRQLGEEHLQTGRPIVYTSSDSVFQIAAHEELIPPEALYRLCRQAEDILRPYRICRVIARPFVGSGAQDFQRTSRRHDFSSPPPAATLLDQMLASQLPTCGIGKIHDLFAGRGLSHVKETSSNLDGMQQTLAAIEQQNRGLIMTNLVDFDMLYGHRLDVSGFKTAMQEFDSWLPGLCEKLSPSDLLVITADHGCDPTTPGTDHTREFVPLLVWSPAFNAGVDLGSRGSFADVGATLADNFGLSLNAGVSFLGELISISDR